MGYRVVVVGATGNVGREMLNILAERQFPIDEIAAVASSRSHGTEVELGDSGKMLKVKTSRISIRADGTWLCSRLVRKGPGLMPRALPLRVVR